MLRASGAVPLTILCDYINLILIYIFYYVVGDDDNENSGAAQGLSGAVPFTFLLS